MSELAETQAPPVADTVLHSDAVPRAIGALALPSVDETNRYDFQRVLGVGGMGEVRLCLDRRVGREVAVKIAQRRGEGGPNERFVREALLQARLEHPAFVPVYDVGSDPDGQIFFTMRRIRGETLHEMLYEASPKKVGRGRLLAAFAQLCLAIDYAHSRGVVHRDLKPANVMLGDFGEVYVLDWGVAKVSGESDLGGSGTSLGSGGTVDGAIVGTLGYMAPEQLRGEQATIDARTDVYALGAILFDILALEPLHRGRGAAELAASTLAGEDRDPSGRARGADVPPDLSAICVRATETDRTRRHGTARELAEAVEQHLEGDRDATARRRTAEEHAARAALALSERGGADARVEAGREAVRALAFDPRNETAQRTLVDVVTRPLDDVPADARESAARTQAEGGATLSRWYARGLALVCVGFAAMFLSMGVRDWPTFGAMLSTGFGAVGVFFATARRGRRAVALETLGFVLLAATNVLLSRWMSAWVMVPTAMLVNAVAFTIYASARQRLFRIAVSALVILVPVVLEEAGAVAPTYAIEPDRVLLFARLADFPPWLPWIVAASTASMLAIGTYALTRLIDRLAELELRVHAQASILRRVVAS